MEPYAASFKRDRTVPFRARISTIQGNVCPNWADRIMMRRYDQFMSGRDANMQQGLAPRGVASRVTLA